MAENPRTLVIALALVVVAAVASVQATGVVLPVLAQDPAAARAEQLRKPEIRAATFTYDASVAPLQQQAIQQAVASARPEAQRLIDAIDGVTTIRLAALDGGTVGRARPTQQGYEVELDLGAVQRDFGTRGVSRLVLHELAHVVDHALLDDALRGTLDSSIPPGYPCAPGTPDGACAPEYERFAETFAKWATGDIGVDLYLGYKVPPPALEPWGAPLASLPLD